MGEKAFRQYYEQMTDDQLAQVLADKQDLVPDAVEALDREVQRRNLVPATPNWTRQPGSDKPVESLQDYDEYRSLSKRRKTFGRYGCLVALGPLVVGLVVGRTAVENSLVFMIVTLSWAICVAVYGLVLNARYLSFLCPQCLQRFGRRAECFNCGFPRSTAK